MAVHSYNPSYMESRGQPGKKVARFCLKNKKDVAQVVECFSNMHKALNAIPSAKKIFLNMGETQYLK
jgi:hypothetical protein